MMCKQIILMIFVLCLVSTAYGVDITWDGDTDNQWTVPANWTGDALPTALDNVFIDVSPDYNSIDLTIAITIGTGQAGVCDKLNGPGWQSPAETGGGSLSVSGTGTLTTGGWTPCQYVDINTVNLIDIYGSAAVAAGGRVTVAGSVPDAASGTSDIEKRVLNFKIREDATWTTPGDMVRVRYANTIMAISDDAVVTGGEMRFCDKGSGSLTVEDNAVVNCSSQIRAGDASNCGFQMYVKDSADVSLAGNAKWGDSGYGQFYMSGGTMTVGENWIHATKGDGSEYHNVFQISGGTLDIQGWFTMSDGKSFGDNVQKMIVAGGTTYMGLNGNGGNFNIPNNTGDLPTYNVCSLALSGGLVQAGSLEFNTEPNLLNIDVNDRDGGGMLVVGIDANAYNQLVNDANINTPVIADGNLAYRLAYVGPSNALGATYLGISPKKKSWGQWPYDKRQSSAGTQTLIWKVADTIEAANSQKLYAGTNKAAIEAIAAGGAGETALYGSGTSTHTLSGLSPLLVNYWRVDSNSGGVWTKGDLLSFGSPQGKALNPYPIPGSTISDVDVTLRWTPSPWPAYLVNQIIYYGTNADEVTAAGIGDANAYISTSGVAVDSLHIGQLDLGSVRWWRIDSNMGTSGVITGDVWKFTIQDYYTLEDFDWYGGTDSLNDTWLDYTSDGTNGVAVTEGVDPNRHPTRSYLMDFDWLTGSYSHWDTKRTLASPMDITVFDLKALVLYSHGDPCNAVGTPLWSTGPEKLYITLADGTNSAKLAYDGDANDLFEDQWVEWNLALADFVSAGTPGDVNLAILDSVMLSIDNTYTGSGHVKFDDIRVMKQRCVSKYSGVTEWDFRVNCIINFDDYWYFRGQWLTDNMSSPADLHTTDPNVNLFDYSILASHWQEGDLFPK